ncbi:metallopeptidase family protein [Allonocardiopsis opalescens]|uniref:Zinicin-like metallopeptidase n=1 Tax=Allonocardiopsis opalescens TaxID=1144618 RepID=A0A2T0QC62_9ACTN|nr:metallopeptidase family protein [Allonocardiopsis opalescens]PRY01495.1 zinicin-like metallopeptidase [Allonocardiopsis opalescens]
MRGPLVPADVPLARTRAQIFDDLVLEAVDRLERRWSRELAGVEFAVEEVPRIDSWTVPGDPLPLSRLDPARPGRSARIVVYRRPLEGRAGDPEELGALVHDMVVQEVANLLGLEPEAVDPNY